MKILTITCHDVYNHGASLQEYALLKYLDDLGHNSKTINYKPDYLSNHFNLWDISNEKYKRNFLIKFIYLILKLPGRLVAYKRKKAFDTFSKKYIPSTSKKYQSNQDLIDDLPIADAYICGSDQIWNSFFKNGRDAAFYLDFVPENKLKLSYAASFAIDEIAHDLKPFVQKKINRLDYVSVREMSGIKILNDLNIQHAVHVLDPVFLVEEEHWTTFCSKKIDSEYIFVYDCDTDPLIKQFVDNLKKGTNLKVVTVNNNISYADKNFYFEGPDVFLSLIKDACFVVSNSFHAVAFSIIFKKQFTVFNRNEKINTRMRDFVQILDIPQVLLKNKLEVENYCFDIDYDDVYKILQSLKLKSKKFLDIALENKIKPSKNGAI